MQKLEKESKQREKNFGITQEKLSEIIDITPSYVCEIERGGSITSLATIAKISETLDVSLDYLVFGINKNTSNTVLSDTLKELPKKKHELYINICESIAKVLKTT